MANIRAINIILQVSGG